MRIVITGTSFGIGRALTDRLLASGHEVWGLARTDQSEKAAGETHFCATRCDVGDWSQMRAAADQIATVWARVDGLVTCAGTHGVVGRTMEVDPECWSAAVRSNLDGTFYAIRAMAPLLARAERRAKIVCFSGGGATKARANFSAYGAAKTAIVRLIETIATEEELKALDINAIAPGAIATRLIDEIIALGSSVVGEADYQSAIRQRGTGGESLAQALDLVIWLLSPQSDGVSGRLLSAPWDNWRALEQRAKLLAGTDIYTLRRITPKDRGESWD